jgi:hypothetical protein
LRRRGVSAVLAIITLLAAAVACGRPEEDAAETTGKGGTVSPGDFIDYEGPQTPSDAEWLLRSLDGGHAADLRVPYASQRSRPAGPGRTGRHEAQVRPEDRRERRGFLGILRDVSYYPAVFASGRMNLETEDGRKLVFSATEQAYGRSRP